MGKINQQMRKALIKLLGVYQFLISPLLGNCCRFHPSCSNYAQQALEHYGIIRGIGLISWRLLRCHPFHPGGYDPLPNEKKIDYGL